MQLLEAVAPLKRGLTATAEDKARIDKLASVLERRNPTKKPLASDLINGGFQGQGDQKRCEVVPAGWQ